jgi:Uncharacterised nucleotidyltransferase
LTHDLLEILVSPADLPTLTLTAQGRVIHQAREAALLGYLEARIEPGLCEGRLADHLLSAQVHAHFYDAQMRWEIRSLTEVLGKMCGPIILLKGAAYRALDLGLAQGRLASDIDLLLPKAQLQEAEELLKAAGWEAMKADEYDQHYYREWMHELPPLQHRDRGTVVDLHHNILPPTARLKPDAGKLLERAAQIPASRLFTLSPVDTLLHRSAHLFVDGDLHNSLRELVDIHELLIHGLERKDFGDALVARARDLDLVAPLYYALYFCQKLLCFEADQMERWLDELSRDMGIGRALNCFLMEQQLLPRDPGRTTWLQGFSGWLLFLRSHWLRMPPLMLAGHLLRQTWRRGGLKTG